ncbi:hypothetical protein B0F90DRAFT_1692430 [Multifurca ochricompacta]|uniref:PHD-type domain-containing protein n=1 Tax=Multifurca ochricompacta TaxID=376703 RepID=A0AAD4MAB0_9AGAM|nr:hypothetical protein B0F90DRAFT_1692430 [Multifurca ochricompacta]
MTSVASIPVYMLPGAPVLQPPRSALETGDSNLATEVLPAPPTLSSVHQASGKRDPRKPAPTVSYLPQHDPGTTYAGVLTGPIIGSLESIPEVDGPRRKRVRLDKGSLSQLAQRGSSRGLNITPPVLTGADTLEHMAAGQMETDLQANSWEPELVSRSSSVAYPEDTSPGSKVTRTKEKGKGRIKEKDSDKMASRVKEEPLPATLPLFNNISSARNEDHCSACRSLGSLVYCDGCTRAYHLWCLDPPMDAADIPEGESRWFCPSCELHQNPLSKPPSSLLSPLIHHVRSSPPVEFQLPEEIRTFFKFVGSNPRGQYMDTSLIKAPRLNRYGQMEYRDPYRTKDKNGTPVLCFRCGTSTLPRHMPQDAPVTMKRSQRQGAHETEPGQWRSIVSCDFCPLHWHLDCLSPPLLAMPPLDRKWMCPNHVDHTLRIKHRIPRQNPTVIDVIRPGQVNNGNIEVLDAGVSSTHDKVAVDEVFINGKRYRVPERVIKLDFWDKLHMLHFPTQRPKNSTDVLLSPLTSLSSLDGDENDPAKNPLQGMSVEDIRLALLLLDMARTGVSAHESSRPTTSQQSVQPLTKDMAESQGLPDTELPASTSSGAGPSGIKSTERSTERKQPARASKRNVGYSASLFESNGSGDEEQGPPDSKRPVASETVSRERQRKAARERHSRSQQRSSQVPRAVKEEPPSTVAPVANTFPPAPISQPGLPTNVDKVETNSTVTASPHAQNATPTLKIRLPRFSLAPGLPTKSASGSPVQVKTGERPRRSLRRQTSTTGSSSPSNSKVEGRGSATAAAESPRE